MMPINITQQPEDSDTSSFSTISITNTNSWSSLDLSSNGITSIPPSIFSLQNLTNLNLSNNSFTEFPCSILSLSKLRRLDLSNNFLQKVPKQIFYLKNLESLNLEKNLLLSLPFEIAFMSELSSLKLDDNPLLEPIQSIYLSSGGQGVLEHCKEYNTNYAAPKDRRWVSPRVNSECCVSSSSSGNSSIYISNSSNSNSNIYNSNSNTNNTNNTNNTYTNNNNTTIANNKKSCIEEPLNINQNQNQNINKLLFEFSVGTLNLLSPHYATKAQFPCTQSWLLNWEKRRETIFKDFQFNDFCIFGVQEIEKLSFLNYFREKFNSLGYDSLFYPKGRSKGMCGEEGDQVDGCATFWKRDKFRLIEQKCVRFSELILNEYKKQISLGGGSNSNTNISSGGNSSSGNNSSNNSNGNLNTNNTNNTNSNITNNTNLNTNNTNSNITITNNTNTTKRNTDMINILNKLMGKDNICLITVLESIQPNSSSPTKTLIVANTHLFWDPAHLDVKLYQSLIINAEIQKFKLKYKDSGIILLGDFNSEPESSVYELFVNGISTDDYELNGSRYFSKIDYLGLRDVYECRGVPVNCCNNNCCKTTRSNCSDDISKLDRKTYNRRKFDQYLQRSKNVQNIVSTYTLNFKGVIDYIFISKEFYVKKILQNIDEEYLDRVSGFPTLHIASDHVVMGCKLVIK